MTCFCLRGRYDFHIKVIDPHTLIYTDLSKWQVDDYYEVPEKYRINFITPLQKKHTIHVYAEAQTVLRSSDFGEFTDGIYEFIVEALDDESGGCGKTYTKKYGIYANLQCCIDKSFSTIEDEHYDIVNEAQNFLYMANNSSQLEKLQQSMKEYNVSKGLLRKVKCECINGI